jgi:NADPH:quinone reductase-like Zn-dependent oxidoreductase
VNAEVGQLVGCVHVADTVNTVLEAAAMTQRGGSEVQLALHGEWQAGRLHSVRAAVNGHVELVMKQPQSINHGGAQPLLNSTHFAVQVRAVGFNFHDVLNVFRRNHRISANDCSGVVFREQKATNMFGFALGNLQSYTLTDTRLLAVMPQQWQFEEASAMPSAWIGAWSALEELCTVRAASRVLMHAATGAVGLLAVQRVHKAGAFAFATTGQPEKLAYLRSSGICCISSSRVPVKFLTESCAMLGAKHFDLVVNTIPCNNCVPASVRLMRDETEAREITMTPRMARMQPVPVQETSQDTPVAFKDANLATPAQQARIATPIVIFETLEFMRGRSIDEVAGKTCVVVGGSRGIGLGTVTVLVASGAHVVIVARDLERLESIQQEFKQRGYDVTVKSMDVSDNASIVNTFESLDALDMLFVCSSAAHRAKFKDYDPRRLKALVNSNIVGTYNVIKAGKKINPRLQLLVIAPAIR